MSDAASAPSNLELLARLCAAVGVEPSAQTESAAGSVRIDALASDHVGRSLVRTSMRTLLSDPPRQLLDAIATIDELRGWCQQRGRSDDRSLVSPKPRVRLRPVHESDLPALYEASCDVERGARWRFRGATPSPAEFQARLHDGVLAQYVVETVADGRAHGLVCAYDARFDEGRAYLGLVRFAPTDDGGEVIEGLALFVDHLFRTWPFRKLQAEIPGFNAVGLIGEATPFVDIEGRLVHSCFARERWWDIVVIAIWRGRWETHREHIPILAVAPDLVASGPGT